MNLEELSKTLSDFKDEIKKGLSSTEQYNTFKENLDKLRASAKKNPLVAILGDVIINPISKELEQAYKKFTEKTATHKSYDGFDLTNDPKAMEKIRQYLETLEATQSSMDVEAFSRSLEPLLKVVHDLNFVYPENPEEEAFADDVRRRVVLLQVFAVEAYATETKNQTTKASNTVFRYKETPFDIMHKEFAAQYRAYMEDVAINAAAKNVNQLLDAGKVLNIISEDLKHTKAQTADEESLLQEVAIQTPLLLKIIDRQITLKSSALEKYHKDRMTSQTPKSSGAKTNTVKKTSTKTTKNDSSLAKPVAKKAAKKAVKKVAKKAVKKSPVPKSKKSVR